MRRLCPLAPLACLRRILEQAEAVVTAAAARAAAARSVAMAVAAMGMGMAEAMAAAATVGAGGGDGGGHGGGGGGNGDGSGGIRASPACATHTTSSVSASGQGRARVRASHTHPLGGPVTLTRPPGKGRTQRPEWSPARLGGNAPTSRVEMERGARQITYVGIGGGRAAVAGARLAVDLNWTKVDGLSNSRAS